MTTLWELGRDQLKEVRPENFPISRVVGTRWRDNDVYGHVNNALYYEYFDTAINTWLLMELPGGRGETQMFVAESSCRYLAAVAYPASLLVTHRIAALGTSSVTYELGIFELREDTAGPLAALGRWVHVNVATQTGTPTPIADDVRTLLSRVASA